MEEVAGRQVNCQLPSGLSLGSGARKQSGGDKSTGLFPELTLEELVLLPSS